MNTPSRAQKTTGWVLTGLVTAFLLFDSAIKIFTVESAIESGPDLGWSIDQIAALGWILLGCLVLYLVPRTAVLGAVLLTAYLGGAVATHLRVESPLFSHTLFPIYFGALVWAGLLLRSPEVRAFLLPRPVAAPTRQSEARVPAHAA